MAESATHDPGTRQTGSCFIIIYSQKSGSHQNTTKQCAAPQ